MNYQNRKFDDEKGCPKEIRTIKNSIKMLKRDKKKYQKHKKERENRKQNIQS